MPDLPSPPMADTAGKVVSHRDPFSEGTPSERENGADSGKAIPYGRNLLSASWRTGGSAKGIPTGEPRHAEGEASS